jgi:hypothetical protein
VRSGEILEPMAYMKKTAWLLLALTEAVVAFFVARNSVIIAIKVVMTALVRFKGVFQPNEAYFIGMLCGCLIWITPAAILVFHAIWIARRRIATSN